MGQVLHGSATTTEAIRRAIQHSQASLRTLAKRYGINQKTVAKWKRGRRSPIFRPARGSRGRRFCRSRRRQSSLPSDAYAAAAGRLPLCAAADDPASDALITASLPAAPRHRPAAGGRGRQAGEAKVQGLSDRLLPHRHRRGPNRTGQALHVRRHRPNIQVRLRRIAREGRRQPSADFLRHLIAAVPYKVHTVLTDNGIQFTTPGAGGSAVR